MLNYKKRTNTDDKTILKDKKNDIHHLKMSDISKIEQQNEKMLSEEQTTKGKQILNMGMDQHRVNSRLLEPMQISPQKLVSRGMIPQGSTPQNFLPNRGLYQQGPSINPTNYVINVQQTIDKESIIVETNYNQKKFLFYDRNKNFLGAFSIHEFIRFITSHVSINFLRGVDSDSVRPIIEKYICKISVIEKPSKRYIINMLNYFESPFMGNIETLIKFYSFIHEFEENELQKELNMLNQQESIKTRDIFNKMIYTLLNHILKIIAALTNKLTGYDPNTSKIRDSLLNYSVAIVYRLSKFVRTEIDVKVDELTVLNQDLLRIEGIRTGLNSKLDSLQRSIDKQSAEMDVVLRNVLMFQMATKSSHSPNKELVNGTKADTTKETAILEDSILEDSILGELIEEIGNNQKDTEQERDFEAEHDEIVESEYDVLSSDKAKIITSPDESSIFNENSESRKKTLQQSCASKTRSEKFRISELLDEVGKLKAITEKRTSESCRKGSDNSDIVFIPNLKNSKSAFQSSKTSSKSSSLSSGVANSLTDMLLMHGSVDYGADESETSPVNIDKVAESQLKHLSTSSNSKMSVVDIE